MAVAILLAVGGVVPVATGDEVGEGEAVVGGDEADRSRRGWGEDVGRAGEGGGDVAGHVGVAAPVAADAVAGAVVPLEPGRREVAELVAAGADVPGLGDHHAGSEEGVGGDLGEDRGLRVEAGGGAAEDRGEVEAEAVDAGPGEGAQAVEDQAAGRGVVAGEGVAGAGVVDEGAVLRVAEVGGVVEAAEGEGGAEGVGLRRCG